MNEDELIRDLLQNAASHLDPIDCDKPTEITLYDTVIVLERKNPNWREYDFCIKIFVWQSSSFIDSHSDEVCNAKCAELMPLVLEYRQHTTINGDPLSHIFGLAALQYIFPTPICEPEIQCFGCAPVRDSYFLVEKNETKSP